MPKPTSVLSIAAYAYPEAGYEALIAKLNADEARAERANLLWPRPQP